MQDTAFPRFNLVLIFWIMSVVAASLTTFGALGGFVVAAGVFAVWFGVFAAAKRRHSCLELLVLIGIVFMLVTLLSPAMCVTAPEVAKRTQCINNLKCIQLALLNYETVHGSLPPPYIADESGKPMHSWRVLILPYVEEEALYDRYNFNEPWDSAANLKLLEELRRCTYVRLTMMSFAATWP